MGARVLAELSNDLVRDAGGNVYLARVLLLSCGCRAMVDKRVLLLLERASDYIDGIRELERLHDCERKALTP